MTERQQEPEAQRIGMKAVHDDDLVGYLRTLGLDPSSSQLARCKFCGEPVMLENLAALFPQSGAVKLVCDRAQCLLRLQDLIRDGTVSM